MTSFRSNRLFYLLMTLAVVAAVFIPNRISDRGRAHVQVLFAPVAMPVRWTAAWTHDRIWPPHARDDGSPDGRPRAADEVYAENQRLRVELANLRRQLDDYRVLVGEREKLGSLGDRCEQFSVMGGDSGGRRSIRLAGRSFASVRVGMPALTPLGVVGRVEGAGAGGATVLLLTDPQSVLTCEFRRPAAAGGDPGATMEELIPLPATLVHGTGRATLRSDKLSLKDVQEKGLRPGDRVAVSDGGWPPALQGYTVGRVASIGPSRANPLFAEIEIEPAVNAAQLRDVMVLVK